MAAWAAGGRVCFGGIEWAETSSASRTITVASVYRRPRSPSTAQDNVALFAQMIDRAGAEGADLCVWRWCMTPA